MSADLLRRAAVRLRDPNRCNDPATDHCLADWLDETARHVDARIQAEDHVGIPRDTIKERIEDLAGATARAILARAGLDESGRYIGVAAANLPEMRALTKGASDEL